MSHNYVLYNDNILLVPSGMVVVDGASLSSTSEPLITVSHDANQPTPPHREWTQTDPTSPADPWEKIP